MTVFSKLACALLLASSAFAQTEASNQPATTSLWEGKAPDAQGDADEDRPTLTYLAPRLNSVPTAVVICPGGGYQTLAIQHEGYDIAEWLNRLGIHAFVLKYRLGPKYHHPVELNDASRAMRIVRSRAAELGYSKERIGVWGFSAGGHLASTIGTHFDIGNPASPDFVERQSSRPSFMILGYPVITMKGPFVHAGSRSNLLGKDPPASLLDLLSNEEQVTKATPPAFLFHTTDDSGVPPENSIQFYEALHRAGVPVELHLYGHGPHGVGLAPGDPVLRTWPDRLADWLKVQGLR